MGAAGFEPATLACEAVVPQARMGVVAGVQMRADVRANGHAERLWCSVGAAA